MAGFDIAMCGGHQQCGDDVNKYAQWVIATHSSNQTAMNQFTQNVPVWDAVVGAPTTQFGLDKAAYDKLVLVRSGQTATAVYGAAALPPLPPVAPPVVPLGGGGVQPPPQAGQPPQPADWVPRGQFGFETDKRYPANLILRAGLHFPFGEIDAEQRYPGQANQGVGGSPGLEFEGVLTPITLGETADLGVAVAFQTVPLEDVELSNGIKEPVGYAEALKVAADLEWAVYRDWIVLGFQAGWKCLWADKLSAGVEGTTSVNDAGEEEDVSAMLHGPVFAFAPQLMLTRNAGLYVKGELSLLPFGERDRETWEGLGNRLTSVQPDVGVGIQGRF